MDETLKNLNIQKEAIEKEIATLRKELSSMEEAGGYNKKLTDDEGFPRPDLDFQKLVEYKTMKKRLNELQTDYSSLMKDVEKELFKLHQTYAESGQAQKDIEEYEANLDKQRIEKKQKEIEEMNVLLKEKTAQKTTIKAIPIPFTEVTVVIENSPAYKGGLRANDMVTSFGALNNANFTEVNQIVEVVRQNVNQEIKVKLLREIHEGYSEENEDNHTYKGKQYKFIETSIIPRKWEGEGILGCRFASII